MRIERFSFRSFDQPRPPVQEPVDDQDDAEEDALPAPPPEDPRKYTEEDLESTRRTAHDAGYAAGVEAGRIKAMNESDDVNKRLLAASGPLLLNLEAAIHHYRHFLTEQTAETARLAVACARKVAGDALEGDPLAEITAMIEETLPVLVEEPKLTISVHPGLAKPLETYLADTVSSRKDSTVEIAVVPDETIAPGDCRLDWKNGSAERNTEQLWDHIARIVEQHSAGAARARAESEATTTVHHLRNAEPGEPSLKEDESAGVTHKPDHTQNT